MKKLLKIFMTLLIMLTFAVNMPVLATETANSANTTSSAATTTSSSSTTSTTVSSVSSLYADGLSISDILNILLIATGFVIILLAIAIFIKVK